MLTGGPHSGKTTLLDELRRRGFAVVEEAAIGVIAALVAELGRDAARVWRLSHVIEFQERIAARQIELERGAERSPTELCFCDRGLPDGLVYFRLAGIEPSAFVQQAVKAAHYDLVVLNEIMLPFMPRIETGRTSDLQRARDIEALLVESYTNQGFELLRLPPLKPVEARADALLALVAERRRAGERAASNRA